VKVFISQSWLGIFTLWLKSIWPQQHRERTTLWQDVIETLITATQTPLNSELRLPPGVGNAHTIFHPFRSASFSHYAAIFSRPRSPKRVVKVFPFPAGAWKLNLFFPFPWRAAPS